MSFLFVVYSVKLLNFHVEYYTQKLLFIAESDLNLRTHPFCVKITI